MQTTKQTTKPASKGKASKPGAPAKPVKPAAKPSPAKPTAKAAKPTPKPTPAPATKVVDLDVAPGTEVYTVGTEALDRKRLREVVAAVGAECVVDCRAVDGSRMRDVKRCPAEGIPEHDRFVDDVPGSLERIADWVLGRGVSVLLLFHDASPVECVRHTKVAPYLLAQGAPCFHVFEEELIEAGELTRSIVDDDDYECDVLDI